MPLGPQNPYASPPQLEERRASLSERLTCPACRGHQVSFAKAYWSFAFFRFRCPRCGVLLRIAKTGWGRWSSFALALPSGLVAAGMVARLIDPDFREVLGRWGDYLSPVAAVATFSLTIAIDCLVDMRFVVLRRADEGQAEEPTTG